MSRFADFDGETYPYGLWLGMVKRATYGKPGQAMLRKLEAALLALPDKRLVAEEFAEHGEVCAVGALYLSEEIARGRDRTTVLEEMERTSGRGDPFDTIWAAESIGMTQTLAWDVGAANDSEFKNLTPEQRYDAMLAWVRDRLLPDAVSA